MSKDKYPDSEEEQIWEESEEASKETIYEKPIESTDYQKIALPQTQPIEEEIDHEIIEKKKRRKKILIIIFAIILPIVVVATAAGFLIWGLVVGFTQCIQSCEDCFNQCFGCCDTCENCGNCCNDCSNTCTNCCGSSETINQRASNVFVKSKRSFQIFMHNSLMIIKWYFYSFLNFIRKIFIK